LVGDIDTLRASIIKEQTLTKANHLKLDTLIIDLSGVLIIDTMVANELMQIMNAALELLGIKPILSGLRPELAQTIVQLRIDLKNTPTYGNLQQALHNTF
jgi:rsbT co-antagonist protein RsbR